MFSSDTRTGGVSASRNLKAGFKTKKEALAWEREQMEKQADINMTFESFVSLYEKDIKPKLKLNTWLTKESIIKKKILPYFGKRKMSEITALTDYQTGRMKFCNTQIVTENPYPRPT